MWPFVLQDLSDSLGISVAGGVGSVRGDIPLYITNIQPYGCVGSNKHIKVNILFLSTASYYDSDHILS